MEHLQLGGTAGTFDATALNPITEPLGMASLKTGKINNLEFYLTGNDLKATGTTLLYENIKIALLKKDSADLVKKEFHECYCKYCFKKR